MVRQNPERLAWIVVLSSFAIFCVLAVGIPWSIHWYLVNSSVAREARLEVIEGTVQVYRPGQTTADAVTREHTQGNPFPIVEGSRIRTDNRSKAFIRFFDSSTVQIGTSTDAELVQMQTPRFEYSPLANRLVLRLNGGRVTFGGAPALTRPTEFNLWMPQATASLSEGSYEIEVSNDQAQLITYMGSAVVRGQGKAVEVHTAERTVVGVNQEPSAPLPSARLLVENGDFTAPLSTSWRVWKDQGGDGGDIDGSAEQVDEGDRMAVRFYRTGSMFGIGKGNHAEVGLTQTIDRDLPERVTELRLKAEIKVTSQSLSGGGEQSSEYPIILRLFYLNEWGDQVEWYRGFYAQNITGNPTRNGIALKSPEVWNQIDFGNLLDPANPNALNPRPVRLLRLDIYASGWDFESYVSRIRLTMN